MSMEEDGFISFSTNSSFQNNEVVLEEEKDVVIINEVEVPWLRAALNYKFTTKVPPFVRLHNEILAFSQFVATTDKELQEREDTVQELTRVIKELWPECSVNVFGSQLTGILTPTSDIDIAILDVPIPVTNEISEIFYLLVDKIKSKIEVTYLEAIINTRVPIIKLDHAKTGLSVDICINLDSGLRTGNLIRKLVKEYPPLRPLTLLLKIFLAQRKLNDTYTGGLGSFLLSTLIVSFLQMKQKSFQYYQIEPNWNLGCLLLEFFQLYGTQFNYYNTGISIINGGSYIVKKNLLNTELGNKPGLLHVQNPDDPTHDMGRNSFLLPKIRRAFEHAHQLLTVALNDSNQSSYLGYVIRGDDPYLVQRLNSTR